MNWQQPRKRRNIVMTRAENIEKPLGRSVNNVKNKSPELSVRIKKRIKSERRRRKKR